MRWTVDDVVAVGAAVLLAGVISVPAVSAVLRVTTENRCLAAGWRESKITWTLSRYCVAREDQSDIVKPLRYAEQHPR